MRAVSGELRTGASTVDGQISQASAHDGEVVEEQRAKSVRPVTRINGERIHFAQLACMAFPRKTDANLAFFAKVDVRTARRWLADDTEPPADVLGLVLMEIMRRFHQR
jgi:hypothetical protein